MTEASPLLDQMAVLGDPLRGRIVLLLEGAELSVSELQSVLQIPQPTVSRHLKALTDAGWTASRADGTSRLYRFADSAPRPLWLLARPEIEGTLAAKGDRRRISAVLAARRSRSEAFFRSEASGWDRLRDELYGDGFLLAALPALLDPSWTVGDLGCGTGRTAEAVAPFVRRVVAVDGSAEMLRAARRRLAGHANVETRRGSLESLPVEDASLDAATLVLVLHHVPEPSRVVAEAARALVPGGRLLVIDMLPHDREEYRRTMGHVWLGFSEESAARLLAESGLVEVAVRALPAPPKAKGPTLFVARGVKPSAAVSATVNQGRRS